MGCPQGITHLWLSERSVTCVIHGSKVTPVRPLAASRSLPPVWSPECPACPAVRPSAIRRRAGRRARRDARLAGDRARRGARRRLSATARHRRRGLKDNVATPGDFTGYGFDQCLAPTQKAMNRWLKTSPFLAVGIYISGKSRACREQPNLTPEWVSTQLAKGWRLLPITLGPQASCQPRFPRYDDDVKIDPDARGRHVVRRGVRPGPRGGVDDRDRRAGARHRRGQHPVVRPGGLRQHEHALPRVGAAVPQRVDDPAPRAGLRLGRLLLRRFGHQGARRRPGPATRPDRAPRPHLARAVGRRGQHVVVLHPRGRVATGGPDEAVPRWS